MYRYAYANASDKPKGHYNRPPHPLPAPQKEAIPPRPPPPPPPPHHSSNQLPALPPRPRSTPATYHNCVYYSSWSVYARQHFPIDLPVESLTHIFYAFMEIDQHTGKLQIGDDNAALRYKMKSPLDPKQSVRGALEQLYLLKTKHRHLKVIMSIGGWGKHLAFEALVKDPVKLEVFIFDCIDFVIEYGFDGIDIDWEYPKTKEHATMLVVMLQRLHHELGKMSPSFSLSMAAPAGDEEVEVLQIKEMDKYLTFWNVMCYDFTGEEWSESTGYHSNLHGYNGTNYLNVENRIKRYVFDGIPTQKIHLGMPLFGRVFHGVETPEIGVKFSRRKLPGCIHQSTIEYHELPIGRQVFDEETGSCYCYDPQTEQLIVYDNEKSAKKKATYTKWCRLGGGMWWDSAGDKRGQDSLIRQYLQGLGGEKALNKTELNHIGKIYEHSEFLQDVMKLSEAR